MSLHKHRTMRSLLVIVVFLLGYLNIEAQPVCSIDHYTSRDGFSQNTAMSIIQDQKGFMWFGTWDGLCRFDGYSFKTFKARPGDSIYVSNSRIDKIVEDVNGYIWVLAYGKDVYRFDPIKEKFLNVPPADSSFSEGKLPIARIKCLKNGVVWLMSESDGALRIQSSSKGENLEYQLFSTKNGLLKNDVVNKVFLDQEGSEWLLTNNGLSVLKKGELKPQEYFSENRVLDVKDSQSFYSFFEESGEIWFGTTNGRVWRYKKKGGRFELLNVPVSSNIRSIHHLVDGTYFISTFENGFCIYDDVKKSFVSYNKKTSSSIKSDVIYETFMTSVGDVWIQQDLNGITQFKFSSKRVIYHEIVYANPNYSFSKPEFFINEDRNGYLWVHPQGGGFSYYDSKSGQLVPFFNDPLYSDVLFSNRLHSLYSDRQGDLWFCTRSKGLEKVTFPKNDFRLVQPPLHQPSLVTNSVRAIMRDNSDNIWIASKEGRVSIYDKDHNWLGYLNSEGDIAHSGKDMPGMFYCMSMDYHNNVWLGTKGDGLLKLTPETKNIKDGKYAVERFQYNRDDLYSISDNNIYQIYMDAKQRIWIATFGGGINLVSESRNGVTEFVSHRNNLNGYPINECYRVRYMTTDYNNNICVGTTSGLITFNDDFVEPESIYFRHYTYMPGDSACLSNNDVHYILVTPKRETYLATFGGGLNKVVSKSGDTDLKFKAYTKENGLPSDVLLSMVQDDKGIIWIATENGLSKFNPAYETFENYGDSEISFDVSLEEAANVKGVNNELFFGTQHGFISFYPDSIQKSDFTPPLVFTDLRLFNKRVEPGKQSSVIAKNIDYASEVVFNHTENVFSIEYAALEMKSPQNVSYSYKLEGFEKEWNNVGNTRIAGYTNIPHGEYVFKVKSTNGDGVWCNNARALPIIIMPSFWETNWAILLYFVVFILVLGGVVYFFFTIYKLQHKMELETQLSDMKLNFFTDISHELRTPLTLITGPIEHVLQDKTLSVDTKEQLLLVERNSSRMLRLINQILDFVKIRHNKLKMRIEKIELVSFTNNVLDNFRLLADEKGIDLQLNTSLNEMWLWGDVDKIEKILFNLLSNAFKYINTGKVIAVDLDQNEEEVIIKVKDTGIGISPNKSKDLFERFENLWQKNSMSQPSTGIGLSMVKDLVELHQGSITFNSEVDKGTEFVISLKKGIEHWAEDIDLIINDGEDGTESLVEQGHQFDGNSVPIVLDVNEDKLTILVVEDNSDVRLFIKRVLGGKYNVIEAANGEEGLVRAQEVLPDLIVSDLMMPKMDGIELLKEVRSHFNTSHIPFIILTAKSNIESQLAGLETGADSYVTKPFSTNYLMARIENLLLQRQQLQQYYSDGSAKNRIDIEPDMPEVTSMDKNFIDELMDIMERNMDNGALVVEDLVKEMAVSRSVFFKKLKSLTGMAPVEFIREVRLKRAAQFILTSEYNMTQIAYMVGINDSRYFSKCFKQRFGVTPTKYRTHIDSE